jgi:hypothetical protein
MLASPIFAGGEREREREGGIYPFRERTVFLRDTPEWNCLCWLVETEGKGRRKIALCERARAFQDPEGVPLISRKSQLQVLLTWLALKNLSRLCEQVAGYSDFLLFSKGPVSYTPA